MNQFNDFSGIWEKSPEYPELVCTEKPYSFYIKENCLDMGRFECGNPLNDGDLVAVRLICPENYPNCLWIGKEIEVYDGLYKLVGRLTVQEIFNSKLG